MAWLNKLGPVQNPSKVNLISATNINKIGPVSGGESPSTGLLTNLISTWEMDETSGTDVSDSHGNNDGVNSNVTINQTGKINKAYSFLEGNTNLVSINNDVLNGLSSFSISCWLNISDLSGTKGIVSAWYTSYLNVLFRASNESIQLYTYTSSQKGGTMSTISSGIWTHFVATYNGSTMKMYKDTNLSTTTYSQSGTIGNNSAHEWYIGNYKTGISSTLSWGGLIDQIAIWEDELTQEQVNTLYNSGNGLAYSNW